MPNPLQVVDTGEASVRLEWEKPSGPVKKYTVKYSQNDKNVEKTVLPPYTSVVVPDLVPGTEYDFQLTVSYGNEEHGELEHKSKVVPVGTDEFVPSVALDEQSADGLEISWEMAPGPVKGYGVWWKSL